MARNKYRGVCYYCGETVEVGEGHFERDKATRSWRTIHATCVFKQRADKGQVVDKRPSNKKPFKLYTRNVVDKEDKANGKNS